MKSFATADDHSIVRHGLKLLLKSNFSPCQVFESVDGDSTIKLVQEKPLDLLILDVNLPDSEPLTLVDFLHRRHPDLKILIFSMLPEDTFGKRFINLGARGFINKQSDDKIIVQAVSKVLEGQIFLTEHLRNKLVQVALDGKQFNIFESLSDREMEVMLLLVKGTSQKEISQLLNLHSSTIGTYKSRIMEKLNVHNLIELKELIFAYGIDMH